jgi:hypothetical protein
MVRESLGDVLAWRVGVKAEHEFALIALVVPDDLHSHALVPDEAGYADV